MKPPETDRLGARMRRDLTFMRDPQHWPRWPLLPLKLRNGVMQDERFCGLLFDEQRPIVYFGNLFMLPEATGQAWQDVLRGFKRREYASFEELVDDYTVD